ncbi:MAG: hypothetical protein ACRETA_08935 [Gammaproteobacteria bacterium]
MNINDVSKSRHIFICACLLLLCLVSTAAMAFDNSIQIKQVPYKDSAGKTVLLSL